MRRGVVPFSVDSVTCCTVRRWNFWKFILEFFIACKAPKDSVLFLFSQMMVTQGSCLLLLSSVSAQLLCSPSWLHWLLGCTGKNIITALACEPLTTMTYQCTIPCTRTLVRRSHKRGKARLTYPPWRRCIVRMESFKGATSWKNWPTFSTLLSINLKYLS